MQKSYDIIQITDCHDENLDSGMLAAMKVRLAYSAWCNELSFPTSQIEIVPAEEFNTIDAGVKFSELVLSNPKPERLVIAVNVAPPKEEKASKNNERDLFVVGKLKNGVYFGGTYKGYSLSYLKPLIQEMFFLLDSNNGSQFRSLEILPKALIEYTQGKIDKKRLKKADFSNEVLDIPNVSHVLAIDNFRNVKMFLSKEDRTFLEKRLNGGKAKGPLPVVDVTFAGKSVEFSVSGKPSSSQPHWRVLMSQRMFDVNEGDTVLSLNSSSKLLGQKDDWISVAQLATIRRRPHITLGYEVPRLGAAVYFRRD